MWCCASPRLSDALRALRDSWTRPPFVGRRGLRAAARAWREAATNLHRASNQALALALAPMRELLVRLLDAWRATYDDELVEPIAQIGALVAVAPLRARTQLALERAWHARLAQNDPCDVEALVGTRWPKQSQTVFARLSALAKAPPDPRIPRRLLALRLPHQPYGTAISRILARTPTAELALLLDGYRDTAFGVARGALGNVKRRACDRTLLDAARAVLPTPAPPLRAEVGVFTDPADVGARSVAADELLARGDPRGEFAALQIAIIEGRADARGRKRCEALLAANLTRWLEPFPNAVPEGCRFERGYPIAVASTARGRALDLAIDHPDWATIEELAIDGRGADVPRLLGRMPRLRSLSTRDEVLAHLETSGRYPGLESLGTPTRWFPRDRAAFPNLGRHRRRVDTQNATPTRSFSGDAVALGLSAIAYVRLPYVDGIAMAIRHRGIGPSVMRFTLARDRGRGWLVSVVRDEPRAMIAWAGGDVPTANMIGPTLETLVAANVRQLASRADGRGKHALGEHLRVTRYPKLELGFDGPMLDLAALPEVQELGLSLRVCPVRLRILELGSGPGQLAREILIHCDVHTYVALDFSPAMHSIAAEHLEELASQVTFVTRDLREPDWPSGLGTFDAIVTFAGRA